MTARRSLYAYLMIKAGGYTYHDASYYVRTAHPRSVNMNFDWISGPINIVVP